MFDAFIAVDWSAASRPKRGRDSIWYCVAGEEPRNPPTRAQATEEIRGRLRSFARQGRRVLVGFDFPFGYPAGFASSWRHVWDLLAARISDDDRNRNNRWQVAAELNVDRGPFWMCPRSQETTRLTCRRACTFPHRGLAEFRIVDRLAPGTQSPWKLGGAGSVGSQVLLGIPRVVSLRDDPELSRISSVWPFEPDLRQIVHVEIWPSLLAPDRHPVKDAAQVVAVVRHWSELDASGRLERLFEPAPVAGDEGWILGVAA